MTPDEIARAGVAGLAAAYKSGATTPLAAFAVYAARIARFNAGLNAYLSLRLEAARAEAAEAAERWRPGVPLSAIDGVLFAVKANIAVAGLPLHAGIGAYRERIATSDAACVARLKRAGAIPFGIVNMHEGALGATTDNPHFGRTHNPWQEGMTPGGSSGGSAAAVAAGLCAFALGTDTMGSVRIPSAYCAIAGFKPSRGVISAAGLIDLSPTLDHVGVHAASARDIDLIMSAGLGAAAAAPKRLRLGIASWGGAVAVAADIAKGWSAAEPLLRAIGDVATIDVSGFDFGALRRQGLLISEVEGQAVHAHALQERREGFSPEFAGMLDWGARQPLEKIDGARAGIAAAAATLAGLLSQVDVLAMPTAPQGPFPFGGAVPVNQADFTCLANFGGFPAIAVPASTTGAPPASVQFIGARGADALVIAAARAFEQVRGVGPRPPRFFN